MNIANFSYALRSCLILREGYGLIIFEENFLRKMFGCGIEMTENYSIFRSLPDITCLIKMKDKDVSCNMQG
jgi:hypothetical protein